MAGPVEREEKSLFCFGVNPVAEKLRSAPSEIFEIIMAKKGQHRAALRAIEEQARRHGLPLRYVDAEILDRLPAYREMGELCVVGVGDEPAFENIR